MGITKFILAVTLVPASLFSILLCSCQGPALSPNVTANSFSYNLSENNCSTGEKSFSSNDDMCSALKDDALNNYCAQSLRYQKFQSDCPGKTW